jgi:serine/threonine protein kinase
MRGVTHAIDKVQKAGYVYEDLKPANICVSMASGSAVYQLIDFGSCVPVQHSGMTIPQPVGGTTGFMAPEVEKQLSHMFNADTWSLGESLGVHAACKLFGAAMQLQPHYKLLLLLLLLRSECIQQQYW